MEYFKKIDHTINGCCSGCGDCCANVLPISKEEVGRIKQYIKKNNIVPVNRNNILIGEYIDICPFLSKENKCNIYEIRPEVCRNFLCSEILNHTGENINHRNKHIINMLTEFYPDAFVPNKIPNLVEINKLYEGKKRKAYEL